MGRSMLIAVVAAVIIAVGMSLLMKALGFEGNAGVVGGVTGGLVAAIVSVTMKKSDNDITPEETVENGDGEK